MKREGQLWIKIFPDKPITKKPLEVRMGKGKGAEYLVEKHNHNNGTIIHEKGKIKLLNLTRMRTQQFFRIGFIKIY